MKKSIDTIGLESSVIWWEKKRWIFNLVVGLAGVIGIVVGKPETFVWDDFTGIICWGIIANILYSSGILAEVWNSYYLNNKLHLAANRLGLFILGTLPYSMITFYYAWLYSAKPHLW